jgi:hypothetical protein
MPVYGRGLRGTLRLPPVQKIMTRAFPFTQASLRRAIEAARKAGLSVTGIRPDGTLIVHEGTEAVADNFSTEQTEMVSKWEDVKA